MEVNDSSIKTILKRDELDSNSLMSFGPNHTMSFKGDKNFIPNMQSFANSMKSGGSMKSIGSVTEF